MKNYDVKRELKLLYAPRNTTWALLDVPEQQFLAIDGIGNPNNAAEYAAAVEALYTVAYILKFSTRKQGGRDFVVSPLEGLWWADDPAAFTARAKDTWHWTMLISQPDWITPPMIDAAKHMALEKKQLPAIGTVHHMALHEGRCAQALHIGSYDNEGRCSQTYMGPTSLTTGLITPACTTRSTSATPAAPTRPDSRPSSANRSARPEESSHDPVLGPTPRALSRQRGGECVDEPAQFLVGVVVVHRGANQIRQAAGG